MRQRDGLDRLLDFIADDDSEEDSDRDKVTDAPDLLGDSDNDQNAPYDSKEIKCPSLLRSTIMNNRLLIFLIVVCLATSLVLAHIRLTMKDTSSQHTIFSEQFLDSVINKHNMSIPAFQPWSKGESYRGKGDLGLRSRSSDAKPHWDGCVYDIPDPDYRQHIVKPPEGPVTLVCCNTTKGALTMEVHPSWAPIGAKRFLDMVNDNFFSTKVPLFRALKGFLVQFGLAGDPEVQTRYHKMGNLKDDPPWLPLGPPGRAINGIKRYQKGYLGYAGAGKDSRGTQLIMSFADSLYLGGGSPWEVPFGQIVGNQSFVTMSKIYTGYGEKPSQGKIMNRGAKYIEEEFPLVDFILACSIVRENVNWNYQGKTGK